MCILALPAHAQFRVSAVDWVQGRPEIPHPAFNGKSTLLQAIIEGGNCGGNYRYRWDWNGDGDFGDQDEDWRDTNSGGQRAGYFAPAGLEVQFPDAAGDRLYYPKIEATCAGQSVTTTFPVLVRVERICGGYPDDINGDCNDEENIGLTRQLYHDRVVDRALWWMFNRISHFGDDGRRGGIHACTYAGSPPMYGQGMMLNAFLRRSHGYGPGRDSDVYYRHVTYCGLNALIGTYNRTGGMWFDDDGGRGEDGIRIQYTQARFDDAWYWGSYGSTAWVEPVANYGSPNYQVPGGEAGIRGRTLSSIGGDLADGVIYCMAGSGQWFYRCHSDGAPDGSTNGWAPEALRLLERKFGTNTYAWAKDRQRNFLNQHCSSNSNDDHRLFGCTYHPEWSYNGGIGKLAGNALVGYGWTQNQDFGNNAGDAGWRMREHWRAASRLDHNWWGLYYMYATTKGMRSFVPERKYFEDGRDWSNHFANFLVRIAYDDQWWRWCTNDNDRTCHYHWKDNWNRETSTALSTQIVQTWLEAVAMARATPQSTGPGIDITFDHSWSHILDPGVRLVRYRWNVRDLPEDDRNGDGTVSTDEINWEFTTADPDEVYRYRYTEQLGWDDVRRFKVTLEVTDTQGRTVYDDKSVQITLSLKNHPPIVIGHRDGLNGYYTSYEGNNILLEGQHSFDVDADHEVFPGQGNRPAGIPDRITSVCFDLDLDGNWCENGEDATNGPATFVPRGDMGEGDRIAIPIRVCDDGRWNGKCYQPGDGGPPNLTLADCTACAFGSVAVVVLANQEPPVISTGGDNGVYAVEPGANVELDLSASRDPEGVLGNLMDSNGLAFTYTVQGQGEIIPTPGFENDPNNLGPRPTYVPAGDGERVDTINVRVRDAGQMESFAQIRVRVANTPPVVDEWNVSFVPRPPIIADNPILENLGNRRYRLTIDAGPDPGWDAYIDYRTTEPYNEPVTVTADFSGDGQANLASQAAIGRLGPYRVPEGGVDTVMTVAVSDGEDSAQSQRTIPIPPIPPEVRQEMRFSLDLNGDGIFEMAGSARQTMEFFAPAGASEMRIAGRVSGNGFDLPFDFGSVSLPNEQPVFQDVRIASVNGFDVVLLASAIDPDGDPITYTIDWGDGSPPTQSRAVIGRHSFPRGQYGTYQIRIVAEDGRQGRVVRQTEVTIEEPKIIEADIDALAWTKVTPTEGNFDGVRSVVVTEDGTVFIHNYLDQIRRSSDGGATWNTVLENVECCGNMATRQQGEIFVASPAGLYFSGDNGANWALWAESKFNNVAVSFDKNFILGGTDKDIRRYDMTGSLVDVFAVEGGTMDLEGCFSQARLGLTAGSGRLFLNDDPGGAPDGWRIPDDRFAKSKGASSISFDRSCNAYQGLWNGYRIYRYPDGPVEPNTSKAPKHQIHPAGHHSRNIHKGVATVNDVLAWPDGPVIVGTSRGIWGSNSHRNAYREPYWKTFNVGITRSTIARRFALSPTTGHAFLATSAAAQVPKYCRKNVSRRRRARRFRRSRHTRTYYYVFCGYTFKYYGGLYRSGVPIVNGRTFGRGGTAFNPLNALRTAYDQDAGGLVVDVKEQDKNDIWLPDTASSTVQRVSVVNAAPEVVGVYRVGLPGGECPGTCCWDNGCNMASRLAVDGRGDAYVATLAFGLQGTITKIAANRGDCIDRNQNGVIDTSSAEQPLDYGADECVLWTVPVGDVDSVLRSIVIDRGDDAHPYGYVWVGSYNDSRLYKLNPSTGQTLTTVNLNVRPFGSVIATDGTIWVGTLGEGQLQSINSSTNEAGPVVNNPTVLRGGCTSSYGMTLDRTGRVWLSGWDCPDAIGYNPVTQQWCRAELPFDMSVGRGMTSDSDGRVWTALGGDGQSEVAWWNATDCIDGQSFRVVGRRQSPVRSLGPTALSTDRIGRIWMSHYLSPQLLQIDPRANYSVSAFQHTAQVYSFGDATGIVRDNSIGTGHYIEDVDAGCNRPTWGELTWGVNFRDGGRIKFSVALANDRDKLADADWVLIAAAPDENGPRSVFERLDAAGAESRRFMRIKVDIQRGETGVSPVLSRFSILWSCQ